MVFIPPGIHHHVSSVGETLPYQRFVFWISQDYCQKLKELSKDYVYLIEHAQDTHHLFITMMSWLSMRFPQRFSG